MDMRNQHLMNCKRAVSCKKEVENHKKKELENHMRMVLESHRKIGLVQIHMRMVLEQDQELENCKMEVCMKVYILVF